MPEPIKTQTEILKKLGISELNQMQIEAGEAISSNSKVLLLSPTGTGKTLAFLLPIIKKLNKELNQVQVLILVPSRELAIQIEQVAREMGSGFKVNAIYGGRSGIKDKLDLANPPAILIGTPGRIADHIKRKTFSTKYLKTLVLDEFDKSLHVGFEPEMRQIVENLSLSQKILTSATDRVEIPEFVKFNNALKLNFLTKETERLQLKSILTSRKDKLTTLINLLGQNKNGRGIIFCNLKDSIFDLSDSLWQHKISHSCFHGELEQIDRENALIKFRNGSERFLVATDLAARGIDIPELDFIVHYELPQKLTEFTHRNGRTARMNEKGVAYILEEKEEQLPHYIGQMESLTLGTSRLVEPSSLQTLYISGGRKDKISKGDIAGLLIKQANLDPDEVGTIELKSNCAFVAVPRLKATDIIEQLNNTKLKKRKIRISLLK